MNTAHNFEQIQFEDQEFKKSSFSNCSPNHCVMVAKKAELIAVRDSKDATKNTLIFTKGEWEAFINGVRAGEF